ncbi:MAG: AAA family ATPase [Acidobacteria bacterium]|nr:AAA family ATPase [Acidobacteriota bacterium]
MPKALSLVVIGRSLDPEERMQLRNATPSPLSVVAELPTAPQSLDELNRLRPNAALVLVNGEAPLSFQLVERIKQELPETAVVCSSESTGSDIILQAFRSGAMEFLRLPFADAELSAVFTKIEQQVAQSTEEAVHQGRIVAVFASKGGCGTTFVAANLAASIMRLARRHTCVVDLNLQSGDQPLYLGVTPNYSFTDVVRNFERLDDQLLASYLTPRSKGLTLLAAPTELGRDQEVRDDHVMRTLGLLRTLTDFIVLDVPRALNDLTVQALDTAEEKILLLTQDVPAIRSAKRTLDMFARIGYDRTRVKVVVNRFERKPEFDLTQIEKVLETKVYGTLSNDYPAAVGSINIGEPLVLAKSSSRLVNDFNNLANRLLGLREFTADDAGSKSARSWSLFGKRQ